MGVIGHPIAHSLSPQMHNAAFAADEVDCAYVAMDVLPERLESAVNGLVALGFIGFNVTMPHKENVIPLLDGLDEAARVAGAVNTVTIRDGVLRGMNTDGSGFIEACAESEVEFGGKKVLLLGAGGAASAIAVAVLGERAREVVIANRTVGKAERLVEKISRFSRGSKLDAIPLNGAVEKAADAEVIVNTTYLGMKSDDKLPIPVECLEPGKVVCDAVYRRGVDTDLVRRAQELGAKTVSGAWMLLYQGVQAQRVWTGREPNVEVMKDAINE